MPSEDTGNAIRFCAVQTQARLTFGLGSREGLPRRGATGCEAWADPDTGLVCVILTTQRQARPLPGMVPPFLGARAVAS